MLKKLLNLFFTKKQNNCEKIRIVEFKEYSSVKNYRPSSYSKNELPNP